MHAAALAQATSAWLRHEQCSQRSSWGRHWARCCHRLPSCCSSRPARCNWGCKDAVNRGSCCMHTAHVHANVLMLMHPGRAGQRAGRPLPRAIRRHLSRHGIDRHKRLWRAAKVLQRAHGCLLFGRWVGIGAMRYCCCACTVEAHLTAGVRTCLACQQASSSASSATWCPSAGPHTCPAPWRSASPSTLELRR